MRETVAVDTERETRPLADAGTGVTEVYHYSDDGTIRRFAPQVPATNPSHPPAVWAIDALHAPLYWFPRDCPRVSVWAYDNEQQVRLSELFATEASRICAAESSWLPNICTSRVYRYCFDASAFTASADVAGQYVAPTPVVPIRVESVDDLLSLHAEHEVELRFTPRLGNLVDRMLESALPFSFVRIRDAKR